MPLLDHFHPPLSERRHWESFHSLWCSRIVVRLNQVILPEGYFAEAQIHVGPRTEVDVASLEEEGGGERDDNGRVAVQTWSPPRTDLHMPAVFPDEIEVRVFHSSRGPTLVAAVELVSPRDKDRPEARRAFAAKCAAYLQAGVGLVVVDIVTERKANLHEELIDLLRQSSDYRFPPETGTYAVAYRPVRREGDGEQIDLWLHPLAVGDELPTLALALRGGPVLPLELETTYTEARAGSRL